MTGKTVSYGIGPLDNAPSPSDSLYQEITARLRERRLPWMTDALVKANELARETKLARGTVTRTLLRLITEGILEPQRGKGYRIVNTVALPRAHTVVSITEFCQQAGLECVSVLDHEACRVQPFGALDLQVASGRNDSELRQLIRENLGVDDKEPMLVIRRARGLRRKGSRMEIKWAILETLFLIERKLPHLEGAIQDALQPIGTKKALGNFSLHRWMQSNGIEPERSEYSLTLAPLAGRDAETWRSLHPRATHGEKDLFIRLRAVTYGKGLGPLLYTRENLVPELFDLGVSGFRFRPGIVLAS